MEAEGLENDDGRDRAESFVVFELGGEGYALEVARVREVLDLGNLTRVPGGSPSLCGLYNLRGHVVPVWNLRIPFQFPANEALPDVLPCVLMVEPQATDPTRVAGLLVDRVSDVLDVPPETIQPAPKTGLGGGSSFIRGLIRHQDRFLLIMDLDRVFKVLSNENVSDSA